MNHRTIRVAALAILTTLGLLVPVGVAHAARSWASVPAARSWAAIPPPFTPTPASPTPVGTVCKLADHADGFTRVCASVHVEDDTVGNTTLRAAGAIASYDRRLRPVSRPLALRVVIVGDSHGLRRAFPLETTRRTRRGPARIVERAQARVLAFEYRDGEWKKYLLYSRMVYVR